MIKQYSELRLTKLVTVLACSFTFFYFIIGGIFWKDHYGVLPTIALGTKI